MNYQLFLEEVKKNRVWLDTDGKGNLTVKVRWYAGGVDGGSCWDEGQVNHYYTDGESEPDFDNLDKILDIFAPDLLYSEFKALEKTLVTEYTETKNEYYGNSSSYRVKYVKLEDLFNYLVRESLI